jgi:hypothetical protein
MRGEEEERHCAEEGEVERLFARLGERICRCSWGGECERMCVVLLRDEDEGEEGVGDDGDGEAVEGVEEEGEGNDGGKGEEEEDMRSFCRINVCVEI